MSVKAYPRLKERLVRIGEKGGIGERMSRNAEGTKMRRLMRSERGRRIRQMGKL